MLLVDNATVVTMNPDDEVVFGGAVAVEGARIAAVGPRDEVVPRYRDTGATVVDARGGALLPGLVDLHYHTAIGKGWSDHLPLWEILQDFWYPVIRHLDPEATYWAAMASYAESIKAGVTTVNDMYRHTGALADAAEATGIRAVLSNVVADAEHDLDSLEDNAEVFRSRHGSAGGRVEVSVGIEWLPLASRELLKAASELAADLGTGIHIHLNESLGEVEISRERFGQRPTEVAYDCGILSPRTVAAHCVWLDDTEIALMRSTGTHISHNPTSNAKLGNGVARVLDYRRAGINVGLGHDSAEGTNSGDLFEVMKFASLVQRATHVDADLLHAADLLHMATRNGAEALGHATGEIAAGRTADLVLVDLDDVRFAPLVPGNRNQLYSHLAFAGSGSAVRTVVIDGRVVMRDRQLLTVDEAEVTSEVNRAFRRVLDAAGIDAVQTQIR